jgi:hypothetical protein
VVRCHEAGQRITDRPLRRLCDKPALRPYGPLRRLGVLQGEAETHRTHGGPLRYPIDLGAPICPMDPEGARNDVFTFSVMRRPSRPVSFAD